MSDGTMADLQGVSLIGALYSYLQHRQPACATECVCGLHDAVLAVEREIGALCVSLAAVTQERDEARATLETAGADLIRFLAYFERLGSNGTAQSIQRTLDKIDAVLGAGAAAAPADDGRATE